MTDRQKFHRYFPAWTRAWQSQWVILKGRVHARLDRQECLIQPAAGEPYENYTAKVEAQASARAQLAHRAVKLDDLRHACHILAFGRDKSSKDFNTTSDVDRIVNLFKLLADPDDLDAAIAWFNPQNDTRKRLLWYLDHKVRRQYLEAIVAAEYGTRDYHSLTTDVLHNIVRTMRHRPAGQTSQPARAPAPDPAPDPAPTSEQQTADCPF